MRKVEFIMGMPITIDINGCRQSGVFDLAYDRLRQIDERFSLYNKHSEASKFAQGELKSSELSQEMQFIISECKKAEELTDGYFSAWASGKFDPSGYVKGWAIAEAGKVIEQQGYKTYCIGAGGDILACSYTDKIWKIGIQDPTDPGKILNMLSISSGAVATSGNYQRGKHIINPQTKKLAEDVASVSIIGSDIVKADVLATAVFAMGPAGLDFMQKQKGYECLMVDKAGSFHVTSGWSS